MKADSLVRQYFVEQSKSKDRKTVCSTIPLSTYLSQRRAHKLLVYSYVRRFAAKSILHALPKDPLFPCVRINS